MSRWVTFHYDRIRNHVSSLVVHNSKEEALKYFNLHAKDFFQNNVRWKADKLPASYGFPMRKFYGISAAAFKKEFEISVDEALAIINEGLRGEQT